MAKRSQATGIYLRGNLYWLSFQRAKKRQWIPLKTENYVEAVRLANEIRANPELVRGDLFNDEIARFLAYKQRHNIFTAASVKPRKSVLEKFAVVSGKSTPASVTRADVSECYSRWLDKLEVSTANSYLMILSSFFEWCVRTAKIIRTNPCAEINAAPDDGAWFRDFCTAEQRDKLIANCSDDDVLFILYCGFDAGLRKIEIIEAVPWWFDLEEGLLRLRKTPTIKFKDREERTIPLTDRFMRFLRHYGLKEPFMLKPQVKHGKSLYRYDFIKPFQDYIASQGLTKITPRQKLTPHIMRHTFASLLVSNGVSLYKVAKWLGDSPRVVETRYAKLLPKDSDIERSQAKPPKASKPSTSRRSTH